MSYDHDEIADRLAGTLRTKHRHEGVDIVTGGKAIEVAQLTKATCISLLDNSTDRERQRSI